ncbi:MAG: phosphatase PAP2 family protein [Rhodoluna sp.]|nr:phosphatase PAP2 family protein [Rhodoluna sp.]
MVKTAKQHWLGALYLFLAVATYELLNHVGRDHLIDISLPIDKEIPVLPIFVIPYLSFIPILFVVVPVILWKRPDDFKRFGLVVLVTQMILNVLYLVVPATLVRPELSGSDPFTVLLRDLVWKLDEPINTFPSNHVALSVVAILTLGFISGWRKYRLLQVWLLLVCASTLFVHQHVVLDVIGGVVCGAAVTLLANRLRVVR